MKRSELFFSLLLLPVDALALFLAFFGAYYARDEYGLLSPTNTLATLTDRLKYNPDAILALSLDKYVDYLSFIIPVMLGIFALIGLYALRSTEVWTKRLLTIVMGVSLGEGFILLLFLLKKDFFLPRSTVLYSWVLGILLVFLFRVLVRLIQRYLTKYNIGVVRMGVIGKGESLERIVNSLKAHPGSAYRLVMHIESMPVAEVIKEMDKNEVDELVVINQHYSSGDLMVLRTYCMDHAITFSFIPALLTELQSSFEVRTVIGIPMIEVNPTPLEGWGRIVKRLFDLSMATFFIIIFSPFYIIISLAILIASPGPLIYRHKRIGKNRTPIHVWKFRTLKWEYCTGVGGKGDALFTELLEKSPELAEEWKETHKLRNDPRVSVPGRILRKTSLDELPQFFNVLGGSLSLVGPRPIVEDEIEKYGEGSHILFTVKPGVTGLWQVSGRNNTSYAERIDLDTDYIEHWNVLRDIWILLKTAWVLVKRSDGGAY